LHFKSADSYAGIIHCVSIYHVPNLTWKKYYGNVRVSCTQVGTSIFMLSGQRLYQIIYNMILICEKAGGLKMKFLFPRPCVALACPYNKHTPNASFSRHAKSSTTQLSWAWQAIKCTAIAYMHFCADAVLLQLACTKCILSCGGMRLRGD